MTPGPPPLLDPLTLRRGDDQQLIRRHRSGDSLARNALIERYIPLAGAMAHRYRRGVEPLDDLVQVACVGLVKAVDRWDPDRGFAFSSFAVPTILGELRRHFRDHTWDVRPPRMLQDLGRSLDSARDELIAATGREPSLAEMADRLERSCEEISEALQAAEARRARSLDVVVREDEGMMATVGDLIGGEDHEYERIEAAATLERLTARLDHRAREVLRLRYEEGLRQCDIGRRVGCSQMHVSRIIRASLDKLFAEACGSFA
jgi:RNA polymerase sigma-B factor